MNKRSEKSFDCVRMKREIQERIYGETKDLTAAELLRYFQKKAQESSLRPSRSAQS